MKFRVLSVYFMKIPKAEEDFSRDGLTRFFMLIFFTQQLLGPFEFILFLEELLGFWILKTTLRYSQHRGVYKKYTRVEKKIQ